MNKSRGTVSFGRLFSAGDLKINNNASLHVDRVIEEFLRIGEGVAGRWIQMPKGVLFLQQAPDNPASGAIYLYDRESQQLYMASFEGPDDNLTVSEFRELMPEYNLLHYAEHPEVLNRLASSAIYAVLVPHRQEFYLVSFEGEEIDLEEFKRHAPECAVFPYVPDHPELRGAKLCVAASA